MLFIVFGGWSSQIDLALSDNSFVRPFSLPWEQVGKDSLPLKDGMFDAITIMFAFHYFFESMSMLGRYRDTRHAASCLR